MVMELNCVVLYFMLLFVCTGKAQLSDAIFDVTKYGAKPNADITQALTNAWKGACASTTRSKVLIPKGTYKLNNIELKGPCKSPIEVQLQGTLQAPTTLIGEGWLTFQYINYFTLVGGGVFDGQGKEAWKKNDCDKTINCAKLPTNLRFAFITNAVVRDIISLDSKNFHISVLECKNLTFLHMNIKAPGNSVNTDGIHIGRSKKIDILSTYIGTGDDCISIGDGSNQVTILNVTCGPGHGISIGSLGKYGDEKSVEGIIVKNCTLMNTLNGVRIKTWPASSASITASDMHFEDIKMVNVNNPILIDQEYCPWNQCNKKIPSKVKISKVSFKNIRGTSATALALQFICSSSVPCEGVEVVDIDLKYNGKDGPIKSKCANVKPIISGKQNPRACSSGTRTVTPSTFSTGHRKGLLHHKNIWSHHQP